MFVVGPPVVGVDGEGTVVVGQSCVVPGGEAVNESSERESEVIVRIDFQRADEISFHDLRHSTATLLLEQGVDLVVIKELLGHAHIGVTAGVYAHVRLRLQRQVIDSLGTAIGPTGDEPDAPAAATVR